MTDLLAPSDLFDLSDFAHQELFDDCRHAWEPLGRLKTYLESQHLGTIEVDIPSGVHLINPSQISIGKGCVIEPGCYIQGPCIIGKHSTIRHGAYVRGYVIVGKGCVIGHDTEVKHSIFLNRAFAAHFNYVGDSILGNNVNIGAGVKCANLRLDREFITINVNGQKVETKLQKLGALIGDNSQVGCNCVINPGTVLGKNSVCFPCLNIYGTIPDGATVKPPYKNIVE